MRINTGCFLDGCKCFNPDDEDGVGVKPDKEWQGLTDEERRKVWNAPENLERPMDFARAIEAKLKEKNT